MGVHVESWWAHFGASRAKMGSCAISGGAQQADQHGGRLIRLEQKWPRTATFRLQTITDSFVEGAKMEGPEVPQWYGHDNAWGDRDEGEDDNDLARGEGCRGRNAKIEV